MFYGVRSERQPRTDVLIFQGLQAFGVAKTKEFQDAGKHSSIMSAKLLSIMRHGWDSINQPF
jgi:hypothetical protein